VAKKASRGGTPATVALTEAGIAFSTHAYEHDPAAPSYGLEASQVLGLPPEQVFKTLLADVDGELVVAIVPVAGMLDLKALAAATGELDETAILHDTVYVSGGRRGLDLGLSPDDLLALTRATTADIARD